MWYCSVLINALVHVGSRTELSTTVYSKYTTALRLITAKCKYNAVVDNSAIGLYHRVSGNHSQLT